MSRVSAAYPPPYIDTGVRVPALAAMIGVRRMTLYTWCKRGWVYSYWVGPSIQRIPLHEAARVIALAATIPDDIGGELRKIAESGGTYQPVPHRHPDRRTRNRYRQ